MGQEVLLFVNKLREESGQVPLLVLPKGVPQSQMACPLGLATGQQIASEIYFPKGKPDEGKPLPDVVIDFLHRFDNGEFPELITDIFLPKTINEKKQAWTKAREENQEGSKE